MRTGRRRFLQVGLAGAALLAGAHFLDRPFAQPSQPLRFLDARGADLVRALAPVVLAGVLPSQRAARDAALQAIAEAFDRAVSRLGPATREEVGELMSVLLFAPSRMLVAGLYTTWPEAPSAAIHAFLDDWRTSSFELKRSGYRALTQLIQAAWFDNPEAWTAIAYPGPPQLPARP